MFNIAIPQLKKTFFAPLIIQRKCVKYYPGMRGERAWKALQSPTLYSPKSGAIGCGKHAQLI